MSSISKCQKYMRDHNGNIPPILKTGRPQKVTKEIMNLIEDYVLPHPTQTDSDLQIFLEIERNIQIGRYTINRTNKSLMFRWKPPKTIQVLTDKQIENRINFGRMIIDNNIPSHKIVFSDESRVSIQNDSRFIWRRIGDNSESIFSDKSKFPVSIMIWGCIGNNYKPILVLIEGNRNSEAYIQLLEDHKIFNDIDSCKGKGNYFFQQDAATCHTSQKTIENISENCLILPNWPANSQDLSPIEVLWGILKRYIKVHKPHTKRDLIFRIRKAWDMIPFATINKLDLSFENRSNHMILKNGASIQDDLRTRRVKEIDGFEN